MTFDQLKSVISTALEKELPGQDAQYKMVPAGRKRLDLNAMDHSSTKKAGVLALFVNEEDTAKLILTLRTEYDGAHSGQVSFPGGKKEDVDSSFQDTALRETHEEIGIRPDSIEVFGQLSPLYIPPSNFLVHPYIGFYDGPNHFIPEQHEVQRVIPVDFRLFNDHNNIVEREVKARGWKMKVPAFQVNELTVWGATAMMISELKEMVWSPQ